MRSGKKISCVPPPVTLALFALQMPPKEVCHFRTTVLCMFDLSFPISSCCIAADTSSWILWVEFIHICEHSSRTKTMTSWPISRGDIQYFVLIRLLRRHCVMGANLLRVHLLGNYRLHTKFIRSIKFHKIIVLKSAINMMWMHIDFTNDLILWEKVAIGWLEETLQMLLKCKMYFL